GPNQEMTQVQKRIPALLSFALCIALSAAVPAYAQSGLRVPERGEPGLDPALARGGLAVDPDRVGFATYSWREAVGLAPSSRDRTKSGNDASAKEDPRASVFRSVHRAERSGSGVRTVRAARA